MRNKRIRAKANHQVLFSENAPSFAGILDRSPYGLAREFIEPATDERPVEDIARNTKKVFAPSLSWQRCLMVG